MRETGQWVDGNSLRVRVNCWRALASNVNASVTRGDPLIVTGRLFTRDWEDENGQKRVQYELDAAAIGHDLSRGRAVFERVKANTTTSAVEDPQAPQRVGGEATEPVPEAEAPSQFDDRPFDAVFDQPFVDAVAVADEPAPSRSGDEPAPSGSGDEPETAEPGEEPEPSGPGGDEIGAGRRRGLRRTRVPA